MYIALEPREYPSNYLDMRTVLCENCLQNLLQNLVHLCSLVIVRCVQAKQTTVSEQRRAERQSVFQPPAASVDKGRGQQDESEGGVEEVDVSAMKKKFSKALKKVSAWWMSGIAYSIITIFILYRLVKDQRRLRALISHDNVAHHMTMKLPTISFLSLYNHVLITFSNAVYFTFMYSNQCLHACMYVHYTLHYVHVQDYKKIENYSII